MMRLTTITLFLGLCILPMSAALAQTCVGAASFASGPVRLGGSIDVGSDSKQYGAQIAFGKAAGPFAAGTVGMVDFDDTDDSGTWLGLDLGYSFTMAPNSPLAICPAVGIGFLSADIDEGGFSAEISGRQVSVGVSIGGVASSTPTFAFVPAVGLFYANEDAESEGAIEFDESEDYGIITVAAGMVFNQRITLRPNILFPIGLDESDPVFGIGIAFNFGTPPSR